MSLNHKKIGIFAFLTLSGCGFSPLYGGPQGGQASAALENVQVQTIPDRAGQVLHQALQEDFYRDGQPVQTLYLLSVNYSINPIGEGLQEDSSTTRIRFDAVAHWRLSPIGQPSQTLISGDARAMNALNIIDQQYFSAVLETQTIDEQLADQISAQITAQLMSWFRTHPGS